MFLCYTFVFNVEPFSHLLFVSDNKAEPWLECQELAAWHWRKLSVEMESSSLMTGRSKIDVFCWVTRLYFLGSTGAFFFPHSLPSYLEFSWFWHIGHLAVASVPIRSAGIWMSNIMWVVWSCNQIHVTRPNACLPDWYRSNSRMSDVPKPWGLQIWR